MLELYFKKTGVMIRSGLKSDVSDSGTHTTNGMDIIPVICRSGSFLMEAIRWQFLHNFVSYSGKRQQLSATVLNTALAINLSSVGPLFLNWEEYRVLILPCVRQ